MTLTHGVDFSLEAPAPLVPQPADTVLGVIGTGTGVAGSGDLANYSEPVAVNNLADAETAFGLGSIYDHVQIAQTIVRGGIWVVCIRHDEAAADAAVERAENLAALRTSDNGTGYRPTLIAAPGLTRNAMDDGAANDFATGLITAAEIMGAYAIIDTDVASRAIAKTYAGNNGGRRGRMIFQRVNTPEKALLPGSSYLAAAMARNDRRNGIQDDISNRAMRNITSVTPAESFSYRSSATGAGDLDASNITALVRYRGVWLAWGNTTNTATATDPLKNIGFGRVVDEAEVRIVESAVGSVDRGKAEGFPAEIAILANSVLTSMASERKIVRGSCQVDAVRNTPETLAAGNVYVNFVINGIPVARLISFRGQPTLTP